MDKKLVSIYIRVSSEEQKQSGLSLDAQKRVLLDYIKTKGWILFKEYIDAGISGKSIKGRKAFKELLEDAKNKEFSTILIYKFDRAFRNVKDALITLDELKELGIDFVSITEQIDTTTAMGKFFFVVISGFAELERNLTVDRMKLIMHDKFNRGLNIGKCPFGYKWSKTKKMMIKDIKKSSIIKDIFELTSKGIGYKEICEKYKLKPQSYYNIIKNKVYIGIVSFEGEERKGRHEPLIDKELFEMVNKK